MYNLHQQGFRLLPDVDFESAFFLSASKIFVFSSVTQFSRSQLCHFHSLDGLINADPTTVQLVGHGTKNVLVVIVLA